MAKIPPELTHLDRAPAFYARVDQVEHLCTRETLDLLPRLGKKAPQCHARLGDLLSRLFQEASCSYGCSGGDHFGEKLTGRIVTHALGSYRLLCCGYYDESLALSRSLGEIANLFWLFSQRPAELGKWRQLDRKARTREFSPVQVRLALESEGIPVPINVTVL